MIIIKVKNKIVFIVLSLMLFSTSCFSATLKSLNSSQIKSAFFNKSAVSISADNLNGKPIQNTFTMQLFANGKIMGKMSIKPKNEPQNDQGTYFIQNGALYITWGHWDFHKKLCARFFEAKNAYIALDCHNVFHTVFLKNNIKKIE